MLCFLVREGGKKGRNFLERYRSSVSTHHVQEKLYVFSMILPLRVHCVVLFHWGLEECEEIFRKVGLTFSLRFYDFF